MLASTDRFLTTHAGSLPRPPALIALHAALARGDTADASELAELVESATADSIARQIGGALRAADGARCTGAVGARARAGQRDDVARGYTLPSGEYEPCSRGQACAAPVAHRAAGMRAYGITVLFGQGQRGACVTVMATASLHSLYAVDTGNAQPLPITKRCPSLRSTHAITGGPSPSMQPITIEFA